MPGPSTVTEAASRPRRVRKTRLSVKISEKVSRFFITVGGVGTIAAVTLMFVFLASVVFPLFTGARVEDPRPIGREGGARPVTIAVDEQDTMAALLKSDGTVVVHRIDDGAVLARLRPFGDRPPTASSFAPDGGTFAVRTRPASSSPTMPPGWSRAPSRSPAARPPSASKTARSGRG